MPTLFLAGDSTMAGGGGGTQGWGNALAPFFDGSRIKVENHAIAGRSSRGYMDDPRGWGTIQPKLQKGDFVFIQFGHNDDEGSALNVLRFRFTLSGVGDEAAEFEVPSTTQAQGNPNAVPGTKITVHTFGYYIKKMATDAQAAGATPIIVSSIPRNAWSNGIIIRGEERHGPWAKEVAEALKVPFVDLNETVAKVYDPLGEAKVKSLFFGTADNTHTSPNGARLNAACSVLGLLEIKDCPLDAYLLPVAGTMGKVIHENAATMAPPPAMPARGGGRRGGAGAGGAAAPGGATGGQ